MIKAYKCNFESNVEPLELKQQKNNSWTFLLFFPDGDICL